MSRPLPTPHNVFWELTRACPQACLHCRVSAGPAADDELDEAQACDVADQLAAMKPHVVVLTGGEPSRHPAFHAVASRLAAAGVGVRWFTGASGIGPRQLDQALAAGITEIAVSLDGPREVHDRLRPVRSLLAGSSYKAAVRLIRAAGQRGVPLRVVTAASRANLRHLGTLYETLCDLGVPHWQLHLVQANGRAREHRDTLMPEPHQVEAIVAVLLRAAREGRLEAPMHCSVGYLVPEEAALRYRHLRGAHVWAGSRAGLGGMAIGAEGEVTGCPCLPPSFAVADVRTRPLAAIWSDDSCFPYTRQWDPQVLAGRCAGCGLAPRCRAGCLGVSFGATGTIGANPYCLRVTRGLVGPMVSSGP